MSVVRIKMSDGTFGGRMDSASYSRSRKITDEVRKRPLPDLVADSYAFNLRIVYPTTMYVVGVDKELDSKEVGL